MDKSSEISKCVSKHQKEEATRISHEAIEGLVSALSALPKCDAQNQLLALVNQSTEKLQHFFSTSQRQAKFIIEFYWQLGRFNYTLGITDVRVVINMLSFVNMLHVTIVPCFPQCDQIYIQGLIRSLLRNIISQFEILVDNQIESLVKMLFQVTETLCRFCITPASTIHILEFPIGNSIPCKLLDHVLRSKGFKSEIHLISLSRNDSKAVGVTRKDLLTRAFKTIQTDDIVIYIDEWITGANFNNLSELVARACKEKQVWLLPLAMLTSESSSHHRFDSFKQKHDRICNRSGLSGSEFRVFCPQLQSILEGNNYFFWSELDRLAGYRKIQYWGSLLSSIEESIELLKTNDPALKRAILLLARRASQEPGTKIPATLFSDFKYSRQLLDNAISDFELIREQLFSMNTPSSDGIQECSPSETFERIGATLEDLLAERPAKMAINFAMLLIRDRLHCDPADAYYLKSNVPSVVKLTDNTLDLHEMLMEALIKSVTERLSVLL